MTQSALFRVSLPGEIEVNVPSNELILFEPTDVQLGDNFITRNEFEMTRALGRQPRIRRNMSHSIEDTGFEGLTPTITGVIRVGNGYINSIEVGHIVKRWMLEDQFVANDFPMGRFGLRLNDNPIFNVTPNSQRGYMLDTFRLIRPGEFKGKLEFIATLRFNGDIGTPNGAGQYLW